MAHPTAGDGQRVCKQAVGVSPEYINFNGETMAEWNGGADGSDNIYAGGKRIARGDNYQDRLRIQGTNYRGAPPLSGSEDSLLVVKGFSLERCRRTSL